MNTKRPRILVTGATGYVGGRLVPRLIERSDCEIRLFVRDRSRIAGRGWRGVEIVEGDALSLEDTERALDQVDIAYYLIHSMASSEQAFTDLDRRAAENFAKAAKKANVKRIIYLGGLGSAQDRHLSDHLKSRQETGDFLRLSQVPVTEFRAGIIIGSGSLSFEMLRYLTERVPVMICPKWVRTLAQPIAIRDVLRYLIDAIDEPRSEGKVIEIGGRDQLSYGEMMKIYANERGLRRWIINVPVLTPRLSSYWVNIVTPIPASIARPLIEGVRNEVVVTDSTALKIFSWTPIGFREALKLALDRTFGNQIETRWTSALSAVPDGAPSAVQLKSREGLLLEERYKRANCSSEKVFNVIKRIGGEAGWPNGQFLWEIRGWIDRLLGGVGLRRGRRSPTELEVGEALDFWRVEAVEKNKLIRLRAEMKVPGRAWLEFEIQDAPGGCLAIQRAIFEPKGLWGILYWYSVYPVHGFIFQGMINEIVRRAETGH